MRFVRDDKRKSYTWDELGKKKRKQLLDGIRALYSPIEPRSCDNTQFSELKEKVAPLKDLGL